MVVAALAAACSSSETHADEAAKAGREALRRQALHEALARLRDAAAFIQGRLLSMNPVVGSIVQLKIDVLMDSGQLAEARRMARDYGIAQKGRDYCQEARQLGATGSGEDIFRAFRLAVLAQPDVADCVWWYGQWLTDEGFVRLGQLMVVEGTRVTPSAANKASGARYLRVRLAGGREVSKRVEQLTMIGRQRYLRDGDADGAAHLLREASALDPGYVRTYHRLARIAWDRGDRAAAVALLEQAARMDPDSWRTHRNLGKALKVLGRDADAEAHLRKSVELFEDDAGARLALARVLYAQGKFDEYASQTRRALEFARNWRGQRLDDVSAFLADFERELRAIPAAGRATFGLTLVQRSHSMSPATAAASRQVAERIAAFRYQDLPADLVAHAKLYLLDTLGAMVVASSPRYPASRIIMRFVNELGGVAESSLVGQGKKTSCVNAALANGTLGYYCDIEPHHVGAILHGLAVVVPTSLAVGEKQRADGKRVLASMVLGVEVAARVSYALDPVALYNRGFHPSAVCGAFGAAAAAGYLFRLNPERQAVALGLAMQQASGLLAWASDPTEHSRPFNPGLAARNGTTAACLARLGFGGPPAPFEGKYDAFTAFSGSANPDALLEGWGERFHLPEFAYKLYSSCAFTHPGLDALLGLAADLELKSSDVDRIVLRFPKNGAHMIDGHPLKSHCAQYILPVGLVYGRVIIDDILFDRQKNPEVARLASGMTLVHDPGLDAHYPERYTSVVELLLKDGRTVSRRVEHARGTHENPLTADEVRAKYFRLTGPVISRARAEALMTAVDRLDRARDLTPLATLLRPKTGARATRRARASTV